MKSNSRLNMAKFSGSYCIFDVIIKAKHKSKNYFIFNLNYLNSGDYKKLVIKLFEITIWLI